MQSIIDEKLWNEIIKPGTFSGEVKFREPMKNHTYLKIGGPADALVFPNDTLSLKNLLSQLYEKNMQCFILGGGTNLLVKDSGIAGVVISLRNFKRIELIKSEWSMMSVFVESGVPLQRLVSFSRENEYSGIEGLAGIPGTVGGAIAGNAGAFDYSIKDVLVSARVMNSYGKIDEISCSNLGLDYRVSKLAAGSIILSANIRLRKDAGDDIKMRIDNFLKEKRETQPISELSAGCVFKNPKNTHAGKLIDEAGCKGLRIGEIEVSHEHANFLINIGDGSADDFMRLMEKVRTKVMTIFNVDLEPEIQIVGRD